MTRRLNRDKLAILPLSQRVNKLDIKRDVIDPATWKVELSDEAWQDVEKTANELRRARARRRANLTYGAHAIKNGLGPVLAELVEKGWITRLTTNGAGVIHDWEFAFQGYSGEDVRRYTDEGQFGIWEETGMNINLAIVVGAYRGLGYGESVGEFILNDGLEIPSDEELKYAMFAGADCANFPPIRNPFSTTTIARRRKRLIARAQPPTCCALNVASRSPTASILSLIRLVNFPSPIARAAPTCHSHVAR